MSTPTTTHIVGYSEQAWGHARPMINLFARFVKLRPVTVTFLTTNAFYDRATKELSRSFESDDKELAKRVRVISTGNAEFMALTSGDESFKTAWKSLISEEELVCAQTGTRFAPLPKPKAIIIDFFAIEPFRAIRALSGHSVKIYSWVPGQTYPILYLFGPKHLGGRGDVNALIEEEVRQTGRDYNDVANELTFKPFGEIVRLPGMVPMYDHEYYPQDFPMPGTLGDIFPHVYNTLEVSDGLMMITPNSYEPEAVAAAKGWFAQTGRPAYAVGPLLPSASKEAADANEKKQSSEGGQIQEFLDATLKTSGPKSLLYISFGSIFWPVNKPENVWAVLDVVMELNIPFIMSHASPFAGPIPDEIKEKVKAYGKGILSPWTPQQLILDHPTTGWFIAHGGHNGVTEAISAGVPQILWPFGGDQPLNAVQIADQLQVGYELLEVRTGHGLKPIYRTGYTPKGTVDAIKAEVRDVLQKAFGEDGAKKRAKLAELQKALNGEWEEGGSSRSDALAFLDSL
ncbi:UDP-Glycosyltransferase/glycogen phosphorylase [Dichomitus squalens]|uniref:UDP-Glycosyltransferase/glycogen phosphorylase n=1 Tax=Dichomitus squalens TaxID=114155 RepID=A0A4Q9NTF3_9APHY|nr:UDP-Glycosyltransferase/glycogen phosphorylase [Dichomitus squalens]TBU56511.1 UDP-Glycosyltransferase/glycogen phosphorylase [Dichomitus squalens]